jgi:hypothetical protein
MTAQRRPQPELEGIGLDALVAAALRTRPDQLFLREPARSLDWSGSKGEDLTCAILDSRANALAALFSLSRLPPGSSALIMAPLGSEQLTSILGAIRAGFRPVLAPVAATSDALQEWLDAAGPSVLVGVCRYGDLEPARQLREAAARSFNARIVCAFGEDAPDGVVPLDRILARSAMLPKLEAQRDASLVLDILDRHGTRLSVSESDIMSIAVDVARAARLSSETRVLSLMAGPGVAALACGPYLSLLTGAEFLPLGLFSLSALWGGLADGRPTVVIAPGQVEDALACAGVLDHPSVTATALIHGHARAAPRGLVDGARLIDLEPDAFGRALVSERS